MRVLFVAAALVVLAGCAGPRSAAVPPGCDALVFDLERGLLNGLAPTATPAEFKAQFPCSTGETEEGGPFNFGGGVFFLDHDFFAYTHRDYIEARTNFAGRVEPAVLNAPVAELEAAFGAPGREEDGARLYRTRYGCLRAETSETSGDTVVELGVHAQACADVIVPR